MRELEVVVPTSPLSSPYAVQEVPPYSEAQTNGVTNGVTNGIGADEEESKPKANGAANGAVSPAGLKPAGAEKEGSNNNDLEARPHHCV